MKRLILALLMLAVTTAPALAQRRTEAQEHQRFEKLLEYVQSLDPPARHTAIEEMKNFREWIEPELLGRLSGCTPQERLAFLNVLLDRRCRGVAAPAMNLLPTAIDQLRTSQLAAHEVSRLRSARTKADKAGNNAEVDRLDAQIAQEVPKILWFDFQRGDEVFTLCAILADFGREEALKKLVDLAIQSSLDDSLAKGEATKFTRTHHDKLLPGGTEMWNTVYSPVWEALRKIATRSLDLKLIAAQREKLSAHFDKLAKTSGIGPNQEASLQNFEAVRASMLKVEKKTQGDDVEEPDENNKDDGGGGEDGVKIIKG